MGYYIQTPGNFDKADYIVTEHGAQIVGRNSQAPEWDDNEAIVCVVNNGLSEAAGYAYSPEELAEFARPTERPRIWLKMNKDRAKELSGYTG